MTFGRAAAASLRWAGAAGELLFVVWCIPAGILLIGLPLVLVVRLAVELGAAIFR